jgi:hypothetical protein
MMSKTELMLAPDISLLIHSVRTRRVILDADLARVYGVPTKALNQAVKRNISRFPADFMFRLNLAEGENLMRSQFVTASPDTPAADTSKRNIRHLPYAFTEHGALMAANILNSPRAVAMSVYVIRAFAGLRSGSCASGVFCILHSTFFIPLRRLHSLLNPKSASMSKKTPSVTVSGGRTECKMCLDLERRRFGASRVASPLPTAATGPSEATMDNHTGESPQEVSMVRTDTDTAATLDGRSMPLPSINTFTMRSCLDCRRSKVCPCAKHSRVHAATQYPPAASGHTLFGLVGPEQ